MAKAKAATLTAEENEDNQWSPQKLVTVGAGTLFIALSIIIYMGSQLGGCMYLDGSHPGMSDTVSGKKRDIGP